MSEEVDRPQVAVRARAQLRQPRLAEMVAEALRSRILNGTLREGDVIGNQNELLAEFKVSKPSLREALRILETEGFITVQRGSIGGAVVHVPHAEDAGYSLALVLESRLVTLDDIARVLTQLEPICAALCAARPDRHDKLVPSLRQAHEEAKACASDVYALSLVGRRFHEIMVDGCGSPTMILIVGVLESLWTAHQKKWAERVVENGQKPDPEAIADTLRDHERILELIDRGQGEEAAAVALHHLEASVFYGISGTEQQFVQASMLRRKPLT